MSSQELLALYRMGNHSCPSCKRIVQRYEKTLQLRSEDAEHLKTCMLLKE